MGIHDRPCNVVEKLEVRRFVDVTDFINAREVVQIAFLDVQAYFVAVHLQIVRVNPSGGCDLFLQFGIVGVNIVMQHDVNFAQGASCRCDRLLRQNACRCCSRHWLTQIEGNLETLHVDASPCHEFQRTNLCQ